MYKSYYTVAPCQSRYLQKQFDEAAYERHKKELQKAKPVVDTSSPKTYIHLHLKPKKLQLEEERLASIEYNNRLLLEKMSHIMRTGGGTDKSNNHEPKSLNSKRRQRDLMDVTRDNKVMMERILHSSRDSELANWQDDWQRNVEFIERISRYPNNWWERSPGGQSQRSPRKSDRSNRKPAADKETQEEEEEKDQQEQKAKA